MQTKIRAEFAKLDADNSGFITKGTKKSNINLPLSSENNFSRGNASNNFF